MCHWASNHQRQTKLVSYLGSHDHGGASPDAQDGNMCLSRDEVQDLSDGLLIRVITKDNTLQRVSCHLCTDLIDNALRVCFIHGDHLNFWRIRDVQEVLFLKPDPQCYFTGVAHQDDSDTERTDLFVSDWRKSR